MLCSTLSRCCLLLSALLLLTHPTPGRGQGAPHEEVVDSHDAQNTTRRLRDGQQRERSLLGASATWSSRTSAGQRNWWGLAASADGSKLFVGVQSAGYIFTSLDGGNTFTQRNVLDATDFTGGIACSADGSKVAIGQWQGYMYTSANGGVTWTKQLGSTSNAANRGIAMSADGTKILVADENANYLSCSRDSGVTWSALTGPGVHWFFSVACSADFSVLAAGTWSADYLYLSSDSGVSWVQQTSLGKRAWASISMSASGDSLVAVDDNQGGSVWTMQTVNGARVFTERSSLNALGGSAGGSAWWAAASSADGSVLAVACGYYQNPSYIFTSIDGGSSWTQQTAAGSRQWWSLRLSSDGSALAAVNNGGYIWSLTPPPPPPTAPPSARPTPGPTLPKPTPAPSPPPSLRPSPLPTRAFRESTEADFLWTSFHNGPSCNSSSTIVGFAVKAFSLQQCMPSNDAGTKFRPYLQRCYVGPRGLSVIRDTFSDFACSPSKADPRSKGKGVVLHAPSCLQEAKGMLPGQSQRPRCDKMAPAVAMRDMVVLQSFNRPDCSGGVTASGENPEILAAFLNTCAVISPGGEKFRRVLTYVSGDGLSTNLVLTETRYKMADKLCAGDSVSQAVIALPYVDGTGACLPDPLHPGRFYMNVFRTLDYASPASGREWTMQPAWAAPTMQPTMPVPTPLPSAIPTPVPSPPPLVVVNPGNWPVLGNGQFTDNSGGDGQNINVALFLTTSAALNIASILYYKTSAGSAAMTTARVGGVFTSAGLRGSSVTFTGETASGWQTQPLLSPVSIAAGESFYVVVNMRSYVTSTFPSTSVGTFSNLCSYYLYGATLVRPTNQQCAWNRLVDFQYYLT